MFFFLRGGMRFSMNYNYFIFSFWFEMSQYLIDFKSLVDQVVID